MRTLQRGCGQWLQEPSLLLLRNVRLTPSEPPVPATRVPMIGPGSQAQHCAVDTVDWPESAKHGSGPRVIRVEVSHSRGVGSVERHVDRAVGVRAGL